VSWAQAGAAVREAKARKAKSRRRKSILLGREGFWCGRGAMSRQQTRSRAGGSVITMPTRPTNYSERRRSTGSNGPSRTPQSSVGQENNRRSPPWRGSVNSNRRGKPQRIAQPIGDALRVVTRCVGPDEHPEQPVDLTDSRLYAHRGDRGCETGDEIVGVGV